MTADDEVLLKRALAGEQKALGSLLGRYGPGVRHGLAGQIGRQWQSVIDEDDVMQVTYLEAFLRIGDFAAGGSGSFPAWLARTAENNLRDAIRGLSADKRPPPQKRVATAETDESVQVLLEKLGLTTSTPSRQAARKETRGLLEDALRKLPDDYRRVVELRDLNGRPAAEVAASLGRSIGAVYMMQARAHDRLRELLGSASRFLGDSGR